jgi:predicted RNA-binding Zn ribbon-like protein
MAIQPAPGALEAVRSFVNTWDEERGADALATPAALAAFLEVGDATAAELRHAVALREALRAILAHHGGTALDPAAPAVLQAAAHRARLRVAFDDHGRAAPAAAAPGVDGALGRLLAVVAAAQADGTWERLKTCPAGDCRWAFYDRSRNRSSVWCDMQVCGNRAKARAFRARGGAGPGPAARMASQDLGT